MTSTPKGFPYPSLSDTPDVPYWSQQLAEAVESKVPIHNKGGARGIHWTTVTVNTDASGFATVNHDAGFTPSIVFCQLGRATGGLYTDIVSDGYTSTQVRVRVNSTDGTIAASIAGIPVFLLCLE